MGFSSAQLTFCTWSLCSLNVRVTLPLSNVLYPASRMPSSPTRPITTFSGVRAQGSFSRNPSSSVDVQREPSDHEVPEKRKPTRVPTRLGNKKEGNYSPVTAERTLGLSSPSGSPVEKAGQELKLQDFDDHQGHSPVTPYRRRDEVRI